MVLAGPRKGAEEGAMYKKWAKHNKAAILATGMCSLGAHTGGGSNH